MAERMEFKTEINSKEIVTFLKKAAIQLKDLTPLMRTARSFLRDMVDANFETEGALTGDKWKELSTEYKIRKLKQGKSGGKLVYSGNLRSKMISESGKDYALVATTNLTKDYAAAHNFGFTGMVDKESKKGLKFKCKMNIPQREFMRINDTQLEFLQAELAICLKEQLMNADIHKRVFGE